KEPAAASLDQRNWKRPIILANKHECAVWGLRIDGNTFLFAGSCHEIRGALSILGGFSASDEVLVLDAEDLDDGVKIELGCRLNKSIGGGLRITETATAGCLAGRRCRRFLRRRSHAGDQC